MTQIEEVIKIAENYRGAEEGSILHQELIDTFNRNFSGYTMSYHEPWCAAGLSAFFILAGLKALVPIECSVVRMYSGTVRKGMVHPGRVGGQAGDIIFYDWDSDSIPDHVGLITAASDDQYTVIECNQSDMVGTRVIIKTSPSIYAIMRPAYTSTVPPDRRSAAFRHKYYAKVQTTLSLRTGPGVNCPLIIEMQPGDTVTCSGEYSLVHDTPWLYVKHDNSGAFGYCTLYYLRMREGE